MTDLDAARQEARDDLYARYDNEALDRGVHLQGEEFLGRVQELDEFDPDWAKEWLAWIYKYQYGRGVLDDKTRTLVVVGEHVVLNHRTQLPTHFKSALRVGATPEEILEVILQSSIYNGIPKAFQALEIFRQVLIETGHRPPKDLVLSRR